MKQKPKPKHETEQKYYPPDWAWRYVLACLDWEIKPTISARCDAVKIARTTYYEAAGRPEFVAWLNQALTMAGTSRAHEVQNALVRKCLTGDLEAIKLWHQLYGDYIPTERRILDADLGSVDDKALDQINRILEATGPEGKGPKIH